MYDEMLRCYDTRRSFQTRLFGLRNKMIYFLYLISFDISVHRSFSFNY